MNIYYAKVIKLDIAGYWKNILVMTIKYSIPIVLTVGIMHFIKLDGLKAFLTYGIAYVALYATITYILVANNYEKNMVRKLVDKITTRK